MDNAKNANIFSDITSEWFEKELGTPTEVQRLAWPLIAEGRDVLVSAPTGTGKTLTSFLVFIDRLADMARKGELRDETSVIYVSPLKSLAGDIRENLHRPLKGIAELEAKHGIERGAACITAALRTGDTSQQERRKMIRRPPNILITTPESLFLMLTSRSGQDMLKTAKCLIIDELHAVINTKRGAHLMLSAARLDALCGRKLQRIGLSATVTPLERAAEYLSPNSPAVIAPKIKKERIITVNGIFSHRGERKTAWEQLADTVLSYCAEARSVIAFSEGRRFAEKLAYYVNLVKGDGYARVHHGSMSKEQRLEAEQLLRSGQLRLLCATSSMELGIDVGDIDLVLQIGCPMSVSGTLQRLGRSGHRPGETSIMRIFPRAEEEALFCGLAAKAAADNCIEECRPPEKCLDILAQHLVSISADGNEHTPREILSMTKNAFPFRNISEEDICRVLRMLVGDQEHENDKPVRPRLLYDRINGTFTGDAYSRLLAVSAGGTIPDKGMYKVRDEHGTVLGELDEEFVCESRPGDRFLLGSFAWQIREVRRDCVIVRQASSAGARMPFWRGTSAGREPAAGYHFGSQLRKLNNAYFADEAADIRCGGELTAVLQSMMMDMNACESAERFIRAQIGASGMLPDDRTIIAEHFTDDTGIEQLMIHSVFGKRVNAPLALLLHDAASTLLRVNVSCADDDDGILIFPYERCNIPEGLIQTIEIDKILPVIDALLPSTPLFGTVFRYNAAHSLMMGTRGRSRQPLWVQRLRGAELLDSVISCSDDHPLIEETKRECLECMWDIKALTDILLKIKSGEITVREIHRTAPSPMSMTLRNQTESTLMYEYSPTAQRVKNISYERLGEVKGMQPTEESLKAVSERRKLPEDEQHLHSLLMTEGDLAAGELDVPFAWLKSLLKQGKVKYIDPGLWIAAEQEEQYAAAMGMSEGELDKVVLRLLRHRGPQDAESVSRRYNIPLSSAQAALNRLCAEKKAVESDDIYYHGQLYLMAQKKTVKALRTRIETVPSERFANLLTRSISGSGTPSEQTVKALKALTGIKLRPELLETVYLPARVNYYRPRLLDEVLLRGGIRWRMTSDGFLIFGSEEDIDRDAETDIPCKNESEQQIYDIIKKRGALFLHTISAGLGGESTSRTAAEMTGRGILTCDSFEPVRQYLSGASIKKAPPKQRASAGAKAIGAGRYDIARPFKEKSAEELLEAVFDKYTIASKETVREFLPWQEALEILGMAEFTGKVRRGYFADGLSGIQFIRAYDLDNARMILSANSDNITWLNACDIFQPWGRFLPHKQGRQFTAVPGCAVGMVGGLPAMVFERKGAAMRVFENCGEYVPKLLAAFAESYGRKNIFPDAKRISLKEYDRRYTEELIKAGFRNEITEMVLDAGFMT
ncbi:MAG: DEAD/DEAH box helicase [Huintestinicola sp.]